MLTTAALPGCGISAGILGALGVPEDERIYYRITHGDPDKAPVVFSHEFLGNHQSMIPYAEFFSDLGHTTMLWDYPWHGQSGDPIYKPYTLNTITETLDEILVKEQLNEQKPVFMGWALGGAISLNYCLTHPEDYSGLVTIATVNNGTLALPTIISNLGYVLNRDNNPSQSRMQQCLNGRVDIFGKNVNFEAMVGLVTDIGSIILPAEQIEKPAIVFSGDRDEFYPFELMEEYISLLDERDPGCVYKIWEGADHLIVGDKVEEIKDTLSNNYDFLFSDSP